MDDSFFFSAYQDASESELELLESSLQHERWGSKQRIDGGGGKDVFLIFDEVNQRQIIMATPHCLEQADHFLREAKLHAQLEHTNIIPLYDIGIQNGLPYFTMKYIKGENLYQFVEQRRDSLQSDSLRNELIDIFLKACDAVEYSHSLGVIHLDIKPANIQMSEHGQVYLADWGLARSINQQYEEEELVSPSSSATSSGVNGQFTYYGYLSGTPGFMAPEQCVKGCDKSNTTDIYALGALLVYLCTGQAPVQGNAGEMIEQTRLGHLQYDTTLVPKRLLPIIIKAMAHDPQERFTSVQQLIADIQAYRMGFLTSADDQSLPQQLYALYQRNTRLCVSSALVALLTLGFTLTFIQSLKHAEITALDAENVAKKALTSYAAIQEEQQAQSTTFAQDYLQMSTQSYLNAQRGVHTYSREENKRAYQLVSKALELSPATPTAWPLKGRLAILNGHLTDAEAAFSKSGSAYEAHRKLCEKFIDQDLRQPKVMVRFLKNLESTGDRRLRHELMFLVIFANHKIEDQIYFAKESINLMTHGSVPIHFQFDKKSMHLDLSGNETLWAIFTLKNIPLRQLNLSGSLITRDFRHLSKMPLVRLNISNTQINNSQLQILAGKGIRELDLSSTQITDLSSIRDLPLQHLNIAETQLLDYSQLNYFTELKTLTLSEPQTKEVSRVLKRTDQLNIRVE